MTDRHEMIKPTNPHFVSNKSNATFLRYESQHLYSTKGKKVLMPTTEIDKAINCTYVRLSINAIFIKRTPAEMETIVLSNIKIFNNR